MVHSEVYLNEYVVNNIARSLHLPALIALKIFRKLLFLACFRCLIFHPFFFSGVS